MITTRLIKEHSHGTGERPCPQCGQKMKEAERSKEGRFTFIWYECQIHGCDGQWLQKNEDEKIAM